MVTRQFFGGVDVGLNGGVAIIMEGLPMPVLFEMPTIEITPKRAGGRKKRVLDSSRVRFFFEQMKRNAKQENADLLIMIETPQVRPAFVGKGDLCPACRQPRFEKGQGLLSQAKFLGQFERIAGQLEGLGIAFEQVHPATWKADVFRGVGSSDKAAALILARQLFPAVANKLQLKKNDGIAEALLIANYAKRRHQIPF